jgi:hypothetical protein
LPILINSLSRKDIPEKLQQVEDMNWSFTGVQSASTGGTRPNSSLVSFCASQKMKMKNNGSNNRRRIAEFKYNLLLLLYKRIPCSWYMI